MKKDFPRVDMLQTGQLLKQIMKKKGYTVKEIQEYMELATPQSIYHWFTGRSLPSIDNLYALSSLFRLPVDKLLCGSRKVTFGFSFPIRSSLCTYYLKCSNCCMLT